MSECPTCEWWRTQRARAMVAEAKLAAVEKLANKFTDNNILRETILTAARGEGDRPADTLCAACQADGGFTEPGWCPDCKGVSRPAEVNR